MNETTTDATNTKTIKPLPDYGMPKFEMPKFDLPNMEMPEGFREMTEKGVAHAKDTYAKVKMASEEAADLFESTFACAAKGLTGYNLKLIEIARANTRAAFDYAHELMGVKSPLEFIALSTAQIHLQQKKESARTPEAVRNTRRSIGSAPQLPLPAAPELQLYPFIAPATPGGRSGRPRSCRCPRRPSSTFNRKRNRRRPSGVVRRGARRQVSFGAACQSASKFDPLSASNVDPPGAASRERARPHSAVVRERLAVGLRRDFGLHAEESSP